MKRPERSGVPLAPSQRTQPSGTVLGVPYHITMAPTGAAPNPVMDLAVMVPLTSRVPFPAAGDDDSDINAVPPPASSSPCPVVASCLPPWNQPKFLSVRKYIVPGWIPMV